MKCWGRWKSDAVCLGYVEEAPITKLSHAKRLELNNQNDCEFVSDEQRIFELNKKFHEKSRKYRDEMKMRYFNKSNTNNNNNNNNNKNTNILNTDITNIRNNTNISRKRKNRDYDEFEDEPMMKRRKISTYKEKENISSNDNQIVFRMITEFLMIKEHQLFQKVIDELQSDDAQGTYIYFRGATWRLLADL